MGAHGLRCLLLSVNEEDALPWPGPVALEPFGNSVVAAVRAHGRTRAAVAVTKVLVVSESHVSRRTTEGHRQLAGRGGARRCHAARPGGHASDITADGALVPDDLDVARSLTGIDPGPFGSC